jgi:Ca2+-binding RTX toxin-like protein
LAEATDAAGNLIFDTNGDGILDSNDTVWNSMKVFQDLDQDGEVDDGELKTLDEWGISQINLSYDDGSSFAEADDNITLLGNTLHGLASFVMNGEVVEGGVGDVSLAYNEQGWRRVETDTGYQIEFEGGDPWAFWNAEGLASADVDLATGDYVGAQGDERNNVINAAAATLAVVIDGGAGADTITGGSGDDLISGGAGADVINAGAGHDIVFADAADDVSAGNVQGGEGYDQLNMAEDATLNVADLSAISFEAVEAGNEADSITGLDDEMGYYLSGNAGSDTLTTAGGNDLLSGGADDDVLSSGAGDDRLFGGAGNDTLEGGEGADFLAGGKGDDTLKGDVGNDRYYYQRGDGHDTIDERVSVVDEHSQRMAEMYEARAERYEARATRYEDRASDYRQRAVDRGHDVYNRIATMFDGMADRILERAADYQDRAEGYFVAVERIDGGIDTLQFGYGIRAEDVLLEMNGDDAVITLRNQDDADTVADERDTVSADDSITIKDWDNQRSRIENFSFASGTVLGTSQILNGLTGHAAADTLTGTDEGDWINAGGGNDTLAGHEGNDVLIAGAGDDSLDGGAGRDVLYGGEGDDTVQGGEGNDYALGGAGNDSIEGGAGDDVLSGEAGDDKLKGGAGNDTMLGGSGNDTLNGGAGDDTYIYFRGDGLDTIHEYTDEEQDVEEATGNTIYQRSGKSGSYVQEMRTVQTMVQIDGGWDVLQFGYSVTIEDVFFDLQGDDLVMGIRQLDDDGTELTLDQMDDVVTVQDWGNEMSRVEELRFGDGLAIDVSKFGSFQSGYGEADNLTGTELGDLLTGGGGNDTLSGEAGDDVLVGGSGDDDITGGDGSDDIFGGVGDDTLRGGAGRDYIQGGAGDDVIEGGAGDDVLTGGLGDDVLRGGLGNDTYIFSRGDGHDTIDESAFTVRAGGDTTTEYGADDFAMETQTAWTGGKNSHAYDVNVWVSDSRTGAKISALEGGDDVLQFGNWIDISDLIVNTNGTGATDDLIIELQPVTESGEITDSVTIDNWGTPEFRVETLRFSNGFVLDVSAVGYALTGDETGNVITTTDVMQLNNDGAWLSGGAGNDTLIGSAYADILMGGTGEDRLEGGVGNDTYVFGRGDGADTIFDAGSTAVGNDSANLGGDKLLFGVGITIEDLILHKDGDAMSIYVADDRDMSVPLTELTDSVTVEGWNAGGNRIELLQFFNGLDFDISEITNTYLGSDVLGNTALETPVDDTLNGSASADWIDGFFGNDVLNGNNGNDFIFGRDGDDTMSGGNGDDIMAGGTDNDTMNGGAGSDVMTGGADDDVMNGDAGNDVMMGGTGNDTLNGGAGNDLIVGDLGDDTIIASAGQDQIRFGYGDGNDTYVGNASFNATDVFVFEDGIEADDIWFERIDNDLIARLHGADDTVTFESWYYGAAANAGVQGFSAGGEWLGAAQVNALVTAMADDIANLNDGTTAYGILLGETPEDVLTAIESAWV